MDKQETKKCVIAEIVQHTCSLKNERNGTPTFHCFPLPRILKLYELHHLLAFRSSQFLSSCPGQPAVELTKFINIDMKSGEIDIPPNLSASSAKARAWKDVIRSNPGRGYLPEDFWAND
ncbi:hypothetical protein JR316_0010107 [Psilocybe cubensis]|uniref:Uncharacterized protein n=2 Tax=Psilocybe cubensis TaxID=181762 RepID=A0A8H7XPZ8_PSICU|nr:hypothetical protein JR316_0010107 [Psilocybe cubensis]KAH9477875.1 hypothetical protein JR316_0010107 [Psilocybe cubensis]